jgi:hypothetical protein
MARPVAVNAYSDLMLDMRLSMAAVVDFDCPNGSQKHSALQRAVRNGATVEQLDDALGNGQKISELVKNHTGLDVEYKTSYDKMRELTQEEINRLESKKILTENEAELLHELYEQMKEMT